MSIRRSPANICAALAVPLFLLTFSAAGQNGPAGWDSVSAILARIVPPEFPARDFPITDFGAKGDGQTDCSAAIARAIEACNRAGGGRVVVPPGVFLTGAIHLKSKVNLFLAKGAVLRFSTDPSKYLPTVFTRWEGVECMNYSALIYAYEQENIAVTGEGVLDGQASRANWWRWKGGDPSCDQKEGRKRLFAMGERGVPVAERVFGEGDFLRPNFFQPYKCRNVLVRGVTFQDSPMWFLHPVLCRNVTVDGVTVVGKGPNNDGCDPESCFDVLIKDCRFDTGDDCIAIKSGRNNDGRRINVPSANLVIQECSMKDGHGGVVIGSEISGGVRNVFAEECLMDSPNLERALRIKTNAVRGGLLENIYMRNVKVGEVSDAVVKVDFFYEEGDAGEHDPVLRNVVVQKVESRKSRFPVWIRAYRRSPAERIVIEDCRFENAEEPNVLDNVRDMTLLDVVVTTRGNKKP
jgi:polygalacturonase